jgi:hypothetical protein
MGEEADFQGIFAIAADVSKTARHAHTEHFSVGARTERLRIIRLECVAALRAPGETMERYLRSVTAWLPFCASAQMGLGNRSQ